MRILFAISQVPEETGSGIFTLSLMRESEKKGHTNGLIYGMNLDEGVIIKHAEKSYPMIFNGFDLPYPIPGMSDQMPYTSCRFDRLGESELNDYILKWKEKISFAVSDFKPDVILTNHYFILSSLIKDLVSCPVFVIGHGTGIRQMKRGMSINSEIIEGIRKCDGFFALGEDGAKDISEIFSIPVEKISLTYGGYDSSIFYPANSRNLGEQPEFLYAGKISLEKGVHSLIKAFDRMKRKYPAKLNLAGSGEGVEYERIIHLAEMAGDIRLHGRLSHNAVGDLMRYTQIFVLPSFFEGLGLTAIEALASGNYVVSSKIPALQKMLGDEMNMRGDILFIPTPQKDKYEDFSAKDLSTFEKFLEDAMTEQLKKVKEGKFTSLKTLKSISGFSWEKIFSIIEDKIRESI